MWIVYGFDENGEVPVIHYNARDDDVVVTGKSWFATVGRPLFYT